MRIKNKAKYKIKFCYQIEKVYQYILEIDSLLNEDEEI